MGDWIYSLLTLLLLALRICLATNVRGLEVTKSLADENVQLGSEESLFMTFLVCGGAEAFEGVRYRVRLSQAGIGAVDIAPLLNYALTLDSNAQQYGLAVSRWEFSPSSQQQCVEVPVRVLSSHTRVLDASLELFLGFQLPSSQYPQYQSVAQYLLLSPPSTTAETTTAETTTAEMTTAETTTAEMTTAETTTAETTAAETTTNTVPTTASKATISVDAQAESDTSPATAATTATTVPVLMEGSVHVLIIGALGALLLVAVVIVIVQGAVIRHEKKKSAKLALTATSPTRVDIESQLSASLDSKIQELHPPTRV